MIVSKLDGMREELDMLLLAYKVGNISKEVLEEVVEGKVQEVWFVIRTEVEAVIAEKEQSEARE